MRGGGEGLRVLEQPPLRAVRGPPPAFPGLPGKPSVRLPLVLPQPDRVVHHVGNAAVLAPEACTAGTCPFFQPVDGRLGALAQP
eukprot:6841998-Alexandrium_andersonii.AAC.1